MLLLDFDLLVVVLPLEELLGPRLDRVNRVLGDCLFVAQLLQVEVHRRIM